MGISGTSDQQDIAGQVSEDHRVEQTEAPRQPGRRQERERCEQIGAKEQRASIPSRDAEAQVEVERHQCLRDQPAGKGVDAEERRQPHTRCRASGAAAVSAAARELPRSGSAAPGASTAGERRAAWIATITATSAYRQNMQRQQGIEG